MILYFLLCIIGHRKAYKMKHITLGTFKASSVEEGEGTQRNEQNQESPNTSNSYSKPRLDSRSSSSSWGGPLEKKILITFFMIFVNIFVTQLPIYTTSALRSSEEIYTKIPLVVHFIFVHIYLLGPVLDPLLIMRNKDFRDVILRRWKRRQAQRSQRSSVTNTLFEIAKISSLLDMQHTHMASSRRNIRRNSCPSTTQNMLFEAGSLDGGCVPLEEEMGPSRISQIRILEVEDDQHQGTTGEDD